MGTEHTLIRKDNHPTSYKSRSHKGMIYEHRYLLEKHLGRPLATTEYVHHLDCNPTNNELSNLIIISHEDHRKIHSWINHGCYVHPPYWEKNTLKKTTLTDSFCKVCNANMGRTTKTYCSKECQLDEFYKSKPPKEQLEKDVSSMAIEAVGRKYGVTGNGVRRWCDHYGILYGKARKKALLS